uniref:ras-related and estrogen-regulated growth inhibitor-like isoform X2 n=1 Tax=Myxine glutinosa TaxID=7769 RepID=UPI00358EE028
MNHFPCLTVLYIVSALTVRFITRRFIGEYDPTLETIYQHSATVDGEVVHFEILDTAGQEEDSMLLEDKIRWGEAFLIAYSLTDRCSFDEVMRLRFLVNHAHGAASRGASDPPPAFLVATKRDLECERMVAREAGAALATALQCPFAEVSARESFEEVVSVFETLQRELLKQAAGGSGSSSGSGHSRRKASSRLMGKMSRFPAAPSPTNTARTFGFNSS